MMNYIMLPHLIDQICLWTAIIAPIVLIVYFRWLGVLLGTLTSWACLIFAGLSLPVIDPQRDVLFLDSLWMALGWIPALIYCCLIMGIREFMHWLLRNRRKKEKSISA
jgi:hypothetical protein